MWLNFAFLEDLQTALWTDKQDPQELAEGVQLHCQAILVQNAPSAVCNTFRRWQIYYHRKTCSQQVLHLSGV